MPTSPRLRLECKAGARQARRARQARPEVRSSGFEVSGTLTSDLELSPVPLFSQVSHVRCKTSRSDSTESVRRILS